MFGNSSAGCCGVLLASLFVLLAPAVWADDAPSSAPHRVGLGWQAGNGLGFVGGALFVQRGDRLALELQLGTDRGNHDNYEWRAYGIAGLGRVYFPREGTVPYVAAGLSLTRKTVGSLTWSQSGVFASAGPEWRWPSGLRVILGVGIRYSPPVNDSNGSMWVKDHGYFGPNLELGVRYVFG